MPKVLPEYLELRRQQILDAAAACFSRRGFHQTTMQDICNEAGLSPGAVYRYFKSKEEIIEGMGEHRQRENAARLEQAFAREETLQVFDALLEVFFLDRDPKEFSAFCALTVEFISEAPRNERIRQSLSRTSEAVRAGFRDLIARSQEKGEIDPSLDPDAIARVMISLYQGYIIQKVIDPEIDLVSYAEAARALFNGSFWRGEGPLKEAPSARLALQH
ncbi:MAG TPA: TetR/AcrR family transcriptional regulator [Dehalococcoidia bacterium]|nr:TetR/AcrR family transcriptional regulator [Dehalococcoidia bacterium]